MTKAGSKSAFSRPYAVRIRDHPRRADAVVCAVVDVPVDPDIRGVECRRRTPVVAAVVPGIKLVEQRAGESCAENVARVPSRNGSDVGGMVAQRDRGEPVERGREGLDEEGARGRVQQRCFLRPETLPRFALPADQAMIVHPDARRMHRGARVAVAEHAVVGPERSACDPDGAAPDDDAIVLEQMDIEVRRQRPGQRQFLAEELPVVFVVAHGEDYGHHLRHDVPQRRERVLRAFGDVAGDDDEVHVLGDRDRLERSNARVQVGEDLDPHGLPSPSVRGAMPAARRSERRRMLPRSGSGKARRMLWASHEVARRCRSTSSSGICRSKCDSTSAAPALPASVALSSTVIVTSVGGVMKCGRSMRRARRIALGASPPTAARQTSMVEDVRRMHSVTAARSEGPKQSAGTVRHSRNPSAQGPQWA